MNPLVVENVKKIVILRAGGLGDLLVTLPAIEAIRAAYPGAEIILIGKPWMQGFLKQHRTAVNRVIRAPLYKGIHEVSGQKPDGKALQDFFRRMQDEKPDIAVHFQGKGVAANAFIKNFGARLTAGITSEEAGPVDRAVPFYYYQQEVLRYLEVAGLIGAAALSPEPRIRLLDGDVREADATLNRGGVQGAYVVLHPCAMDIRRRWPPEKFSALGDKLAQKGYTVLFTGSTAEEPVAEAIIENMQYPAVNICHDLSLGGLAAVFAKSELVISADSGPLHLARAVGAWTVGMYWAPNYINWGPMLLSNHKPLISWNMACPYCGVVPNDPYPFEPQSAACDHRISFIRDISVEEVTAAAEALLDRREITPGQRRQASGRSLKTTRTSLTPPKTGTEKEYHEGTM